MEKSEVQSLIKSKSQHIVYEANAGTSKAWKLFELMKVDGACVNYVKCVKCHTALKWKSKSTSGLNEHIQSCASNQPSSVRTVADMFVTSTSTQLTLQGGRYPRSNHLCKFW